jgi:hypothetical protein
MTDKMGAAPGDDDGYGDWMSQVFADLIVEQPAYGNETATALSPGLYHAKTMVADEPARGGQRHIAGLGMLNRLSAYGLYLTGGGAFVLVIAFVAAPDRAIAIIANPSGLPLMAAGAFHAVARVLGWAA